MNKLHAVTGVRIGTTCAGIKQTSCDDLVVFEIADTASVAAVFTTNKFCAAPVTVAKKHLRKTTPNYLLINSGNANAGLGAAGIQATDVCCKVLAESVRCTPDKVLPFSTGVIGEDLPIDKIMTSIPGAVSNLDSGNWAKAASAILTTDTKEKACSREIQVAGKTAVITGIAKGSGMIRPDMATMLAYIATDIRVEESLLKGLLKEAVNSSFNSITVDGDTSTNDAAVLIASGTCLGANLKDKNSSGYQEFKSALIEVCQFLATEIVRDGEGATKLIRVQIESAATQTEAKELAYTIAHSPLVKTAFFAADPNWGRILAAAGRAKVECLEVEKICIYLDDVCIVRDGMRAKEYTEQAGQAVLNKKEITIRLSLEQGNFSTEVLTCDLSYDYVKINAEYRT